MLKNTITFSVLLMAVSAFGLLLFPSKMLSVVGIVSNPQLSFLLQASGVGVAALIPGIWSVRNAAPSLLSRAVLYGLAIYMFLSSIVDLLAYVQSIVNTASIPSIFLRLILGSIIIWSLIKEETQI